VAVTLVQSKQGQTSASSTLTITLTSPTTAGNCLAVAISTTAPTVSGVTLGGSADNFAQVAGTGVSAPPSVWAWADPNCAGGQTSVVITASASGGIAATVYEVSGLALTIASLIDQKTSQNGLSGAWSSGSTPATVNPNDFWFGAVGIRSSSPSITGPSSPWSNQATLTGVNGTSYKSGSQITSSTGSVIYSGTSSVNVTCTAVVAALKSPPAITSGGATLSGAGSLSAPSVQRSSGATLAAAGSLASSATVFTPPPTFPGKPPNPLGLKIELLLGAVWTDVTQYCMYRDGLTISNMGRTDESGSITAGQLTLTLKNDGRFTPKNSSGAYYPNIVRNAQIRVSISTQSKTGSVYSGFRFWGEVSSWPPGYDTSQRDLYVQVTASGIWRRIEANQVSIGSAYSRYVSLLTGTSVPAAWWAMEDGSGSTSFVLSGGSGSNMAMTSPPSFAADNTSFAGSDALPQFNGARITGGISGGTPTNNVVRFALSVPSAGDSNLPSSTILVSGVPTGAVANWLSAGTIHVVNIWLDTAGKLTIRGRNASNTILFTSTIATPVNGTPVLVSVEFTPSGGNVAWAMKIIKPGAGTVLDSVSGTVTSATVGAISSPGVTLNGNGVLADTACGQLGVWYASVPSLVTAASALSGYAGEAAAARFTRICGEFGIPAAVFGSTSAAMGPQVDGKLSDVLQSIENTDGGILYETRDQFGLGYRTLASLKNQSATVTVDYTAGVLGAPLAPVYDDQLIVNQWTVTNYDGYSALAQVTSGAISTQAPPSGMGSGYAKSRTINAQADSQANTIAQQLLFQGTTDEVRYPVVAFNFARAQAAPFFALVPGLRFGDYLAITNLPAFLGGGTTKQLIWGYTEHLTGMTWDIGYNTVPEAPFETAFSPGVFSVAQAPSGGVAAGSQVGSTVSASQLGSGAALPGTISARTIGGITQFISAATPYDWTFAVSGTPADATYFICTQAQAQAIAVGDTFTSSGGLGGPFTVTGISAAFAGFVNVAFSPDAAAPVSSGQTVFGGKNGDTWVNTSAGNQVNQWQAGAWVPITWDASQVIQANTVTATQIAAGTVIAGVVDGTLIQGVTIIATGTSGEYLAYSGTPAAGNLVFSVSPVAGTDGFGNSYLAGSTSYTLSGGTYLASSLQAGSIKTYTATSSAGPWSQIGNSGSATGGDYHFGATGGAHLVADTRWFGIDGSGNRSDWTDFPAFQASWGRGTGGYAQYRKTPSGDLQVTISLRLIGTKTDGTVILAAGGWGDSTFWPSVAGKYLPVSLDTSGAAFYAGNHTPYLVFRTDGSVAVFGVNAAGLSQLDCHGLLPIT
jgi:hypothetical protein